MKRNGVPVRQTFDGLSHRQLLLYAQELGEQFRRERGLLSVLSERDQQIRRMAAASLSAQEEERQWIAYEVHDRIAQTLAAVFQQLQVLESLTQADPQRRQVVVRASVLTREAIREARNIMNDLHPPTLNEFGLSALVEEELSRFQEETECLTTLDADYPIRPSLGVEVALYRIFHEALFNVRRHAGAKNVAVSLWRTDRGISLHVQDDGPGFDIQAAMQKKRVGGLLSMRRRAEVIGGTLDIISTPSRGTRVAIHVPIINDETHEEIRTREDSSEYCTEH